MTESPGSETPTTGPGSGQGGAVRVSGPQSATLEAVMADYLERHEAGESPSPRDYLQRYPEHAAELKSFFRNHCWLAETGSEPEDALLGARVGPYLIESEIARGGMGVVYRARQQDLQRPVALKLISSGVLAGGEERRRFRIEAEAAARLHHPGIIAIHEIGSWQGCEYFSMPLIDGATLQQHVTDRDLSDLDVARFVREIAHAVAYAHRHGIVHRDLKPDNILISEDGRPLVADFGLAKWHRDGTVITRTGQVLGTPHYMSPEQACGRGECGAASDIYSLGAILYALLTGRPPHLGDTAAEVLRSVLQDEPETPRQLRREISPDLEKICLKAMNYEPSLRYETAETLAEDLDRFLAGEPTSAAGSGLLDRVAREIRRDQHQSYFESWSRTLICMGGIIFVAHLAIFVGATTELPRWAAFWSPRVLMLLAIFAVIYRARCGALLPRSVAERPVYSIWIAYLLTLGTVNVLVGIEEIPQQALFPITSALSGFGFIAMAGHVWGGAALFGFAFLILAVLATMTLFWAPLAFGALWLVSLLSLAHHYRRQ